MPTVVTTPGSASANSYASVAEADAYHTVRLFSSTWTSASTPTKESALIMATRLMDAFFEWTGSPVDSVQALAWPRQSMVNRNGFAIAENVIPEELKNATAEFARQLIAADRSADSSAEFAGLASLTAGPVSLKFRENINAAEKVVPNAVRSLLVPSWYEEEENELDVFVMLGND